MKIRSLNFKINTAILITCLIIAVIFGAILYPFEMNRHVSQFKRINFLLDVVFQQKKEDLANEIFAEQKKALAETLKDILKVEGIAAVSVYNMDGDLILSGGKTFANSIPAIERKALSLTRSFLNESHQSRSFAVSSTAIEVIGRHIGYLKMYYDLTEMHKETRLSIMIFLTLLITVLLLMSGLLNFLFSRFVTRPVSVLREAMKKVQAGHLGKQVFLQSKDEIGDVAAVFNHMSANLYEKQVALKKAEEKYRGIFENAVEGIFQTTPDGRFISANPALAKIMGFASPEELIRSISDIEEQCYVIPEEREKYHRIVRERGSLTGFETQIYRRDGSKIWVSKSGRAVMDTSDEVRYYEGSVLDITEQREKEQAEKERKAAEAASQAKSDFLSAMSHEIRTPLNAIIGLSNLALSTGDPETKREYLEMINRSSDILLNLINDVLDLAKIESGKLELNETDFNLHDIVMGTLGTLSFQARQKGLKYTILFDPEINIRLYGDAVRLSQVLTNIAGNAVKFTQRGEIKVAVTKEKNADYKDGDTIRLLFSIKDTGIGIPAERQSTLFESFTQADKSNTRKFGGTGLGTTIARQLVELMGGNIRFQSKPGKGSLFEFTVPFKVLAEPDERSKDSRIKNGHFPSAGSETALNILLAEDNYFNQRVTADSLRLYGHRVTIANNGSEAIELWKGGEFNIILMDVQMPGVNGLEATCAIREIEKTEGGHIHIKALTANAMKEDREKCLKAGMDDYISKPININELVRKLDTFFLEQNAIKTSTREEKKAEYDTIFNMDIMPSLLRHDEDMQKKYIKIFMEDMRQGISQMEKAIQDVNHEALERAAHSVKGTVGHIKSGYLAKLAFQLEEMGRRKEMEGAREKLAELKEEYEKVEKIIGKG